MPKAIAVGEVATLERTESLGALTAQGLFPGYEVVVGQGVDNIRAFLCLHAFDSF